MQMNFQSLGFDGIPQQEREANRRYWDSLASLGNAIGEAGKEVDSWQKRKAEEEERKKQWENMLEEQKYRREVDEYNRYYQAERDFKNDQRYIDERRRQMETEKRDADALAAAKSQMRKDPLYSPTRIRMEYGPQAYAAAVARDNAPTYAEYMNAQRDFDSAVNQRLIYKMQQEQNERAARLEEQAKIAENMLNEVAARENASKFNYNVNAKLPPKEVLPAYRDEIQENLDYLLSDKTPSLSKNNKIKEYKTLLDMINERLNYKPKKSIVDKMLGY